MFFDVLLQLTMAAAGSFGFGVLFHLKGGKLGIAAAGGAWNWMVYLIAFNYTESRVMGFFIASLVTALTAELLARVRKEPVITLVVPMVIPLVPGGDLYYTTLALVSQETEDFIHYGNLVFWEVLAMSMGLILAACIVQTIWKIFLHRHLRRKAKTTTTQ